MGKRNTRPGRPGAEECHRGLGVSSQPSPFEMSYGTDFARDLGLDPAHPSSAAISIGVDQPP